MDDINRTENNKKPVLTNAERVAAWRKRHNPKRKVAEIPRDTAEIFEEKLAAESKSYQGWLMEQIHDYIDK